MQIPNCRKRKNPQGIVENTQSAESTIRDTDMATQMAACSNNQILAQAVLAQSNQAEKNYKGKGISASWFLS